jgi:hypothetical protein
MVNSWLVVIGIEQFGFGTCLPGDEQAGFARTHGWSFYADIWCWCNTCERGSFDQTIRLWALPTGNCIRVLRGPTGGVWSVALSPDGQVFASGSGSRTVRLWNLLPGSCLKVLHEHTSWLTSVIFSSNGQVVVSGTDDWLGSWRRRTAKFCTSWVGCPRSAWRTKPRCRGRGNELSEATVDSLI